MMKKIVKLLLLAVFLLCAVSFGVTTAFAAENDSGDGATTVTYDCTQGGKNSPHTINVGDVTMQIKYGGMYNNGYPAYNGNSSFSVTIYPLPGYVINYVTLTSSLGNPLEPRELRYEGLEATYENGNMTVTGMQPGQTYEVSTNGGAEGLLTGITVNYEKHVHSGEYTPGQDENSHYKQCVCLLRVDEESHTWGEAVVAKEPVVNKNGMYSKGIIEKTCTNEECKYTKSEKFSPDLSDCEVVLTNELTYTGSIQFQYYELYYKGAKLGTSQYKIGEGVARGKEVGEYTFTLVPKTENTDCIFTCSKVVTFTIKKVSVPKPAPDPTKYVYENGVTHTYTIGASDFYGITNEVSKQTPGTYDVIISLTDKTNSQWEDGTSDDLVYQFVIHKGDIDMSAVVFADKTVDYNGSAFSIEATNLPDGVSVTYENNGKTDAGVYTVTAKFTGNANYNAIPDMTATLTINKLTYDMSGVVFEDKTVDYNGSAFSIEATNLPDGVSVLYENNAQINAGVYTVTAKFTGNANYNAIPDMTATLTVNKLTYDMSGVSFAGNTVTYDGNAHPLAITGTLPDGVSVLYENNAQINAGVYTVTAKFTGNANYNAIPDMTATLTVNKATYDMSGVVFADKTVVYNGSAFSIEATNLPSGVSVLYENNAQINAGVYTVTAKFTGNANYNAIPDMTATLTVNKATYDMSGVVFADKTVVYNGSAFSIEAANLPDGVSVLYENNAQINAGVYTVTAKFTGNANYNAIPDMTATLTVKTASLGFHTDSENENVEDVVVFAPNGIDPTKELVVTKVKENVDYADLIGEKQKAAVAYDIKLLKDGAVVQPDGTLQFKVLIPEELRGKSFSVIHIHNSNEVNTIEHQVNGDYVVFESDKLSDFVFVYEVQSLLWLVVVLAVIVVAEIAAFVFFVKKKKQLKGVKLASVYPPFVFGMFVPEMHLVLIIALAIAAIALAAIDVIFAVGLLKQKPLVCVTETDLDEEEPVEQITEDESEDPRKCVVDIVWKKNSKSGKVYRYNVPGGRVKAGDAVTVPTFDASSQKEVVRKAYVVNVTYYEEGEDIALPEKEILSIEKK